jgi:hypothetical protein
MSARIGFTLSIICCLSGVPRGIRAPSCSSSALEVAMATATPSYRSTDRGAVRSDVSRERRTFTETKAFYKTSEFLVWLVSVAGVLVVTYINDSNSLSNWHGWLLVTVLSAAYMFSRGIAKSGSREPYTDRDDY